MGPPPHHVALHQPIRYFALRRDHLGGSGRRLLWRELALLAEGELGYVVLDLYLARLALIKLNGEGGVALDHRGRWGGGDTWGRGSGRVRDVLGGHLLDHPLPLPLLLLLLRCIGGALLELPGGDLKVAGLAAVREHGLAGVFRQRAVDSLSGQVSHYQENKRGGGETPSIQNIH